MKGNCAFDLREEVMMMNKEMLHRMKIAGEYQKKAVRALFPEEMDEHFQVIEKEIKMMVMEIAAEWIKKCQDSDSGKNPQENEETTRVKKVDIV